AAASAPTAPSPAAPDADPIDLFAPLHVSPQTPGTRAPQGEADTRRPRAERTRATKSANDRQRGGKPAGDKPATRKEPAAPERRRSFLTPERAEEPAEKGWRGFLAKTGMRVPPSADERAERADMFTVSQHWPGPRTIAIVNAKGGSGKTPTTILTAAVFARYGGAGVLAWDQIVLATTTRAEHAEAGALLLEALADRDARSASLVENSVAIVSQADPHASAAEVRSVVDGYRDLSRDVAAIPYDPAMAGGYLHFTALRPATRRAWLGATAAIARGLGPQRP
ncbi:ParA family protein, partial [Microbacterium paludicola]|nr:ParA family protein [Microbacterium paludicola]